MTDYSDDGWRQDHDDRDRPARNERDDYLEWCEAQDARNNEPYLPGPECFGLCPSGLHDAGTCTCGCPALDDGNYPF